MSQTIILWTVRNCVTEEIKMCVCCIKWGAVLDCSRLNNSGKLMLNIAKWISFVLIRLGKSDRAIQKHVASIAREKSFFCTCNFFLVILVVIWQHIKQGTNYVLNSFVHTKLSSKNMLQTIPWAGAVYCKSFFY